MDYGLNYFMENKNWRFKLKDDLIIKKWQAIISVTIMVLSIFASIVITFQALKSDVDNHIENKNIHRTYEQDVKDFVTRPEYNSFENDTHLQLQDIKADIREIKNDIKKLLQRR